MYKRFSVVLSLFLSLCAFFGCSNAGSSHDQAVSGEGTICGSVLIKGAVPKTLSPSYARSASPADPSGTLFYKVVAARPKSDVESDPDYYEPDLIGETFVSNSTGYGANGNVTQTGSEVTFSIKLPVGTWILAGYVYTGSSEDPLNLVLQGKTGRLTVGPGEVISDIQINTRAFTGGTGKGTVNLEISTTYNQIYKVKCFYGPAECQEVYVTNLSPGNFTANGTALDSGAYPVTFRFYDGSNTFVFSCVEVVNVFSNMETNSWQKDSASSEYLVEFGSTTRFVLSEEAVEKFIKRTIYVQGDATSDHPHTYNVDTNRYPEDQPGLRDGTFFAPYKTLHQAIDRLTTLGSSESCTIIVDGKVPFKKNDGSGEIFFADTTFPTFTIESFSAENRALLDFMQNDSAFSRADEILVKKSINLNNVDIVCGYSDRADYSLPEDCIPFKIEYDDINPQIAKFNNVRLVKGVLALTKSGTLELNGFTGEGDIDWSGVTDDDSGNRRPNNSSWVEVRNVSGTLKLSGAIKNAYFILENTQDSSGGMPGPNNEKLPHLTISGSLSGSSGNFVEVLERAVDSPSAGSPFVFTSGYPTANGTVRPSTYFTALSYECNKTISEYGTGQPEGYRYYKDKRVEYGIGRNADGEAQMMVGGGKWAIEKIDISVESPAIPLAVSISDPVTTDNPANILITFKATDQDGEDVTNDLTWDFAVYDYGDKVMSDFYNTLNNVITIKRTSLREPGTYQIFVTVTDSRSGVKWNGTWPLEVTN